MPDLTRIEDRVSAPTRPTSGDCWKMEIPPAHESLRACVESGKLTIMRDGSFRGQPCPCVRCTEVRNQAQPREVKVSLCSDCEQPEESCQCGRFERGMD